MDEETVSGATAGGIQSEEDLQQMIEQEAWYDSDSDDEVSTRTVETDSESDPSYYRSETNWKLLWQEGKDEDDPEFNSPSVQQPRTHSDIVEDLLTQLTQVEGYSQIVNEELGGQHTQGRIEADSGDDIDGSLQTGAAKLTIDDETSPYVVPDLSTHVVFDGESPLETEPKKPKYYRIALEILTSERTYVQNLRFLEKTVHEAVKAKHNLTKKAILSESERKEIFINAGEIYAVNFDLLQELEERLKNWDSNSVVVDVIASRAPFFKLYSVYSERFDKAQDAYHQRLKTSKLFAKLMGVIESSPTCNGLKVSSSMITPIQRIPRYELLLKDYIKHLPKDHPDLVNAKAALAVIIEAAKYMNSRITEFESQAVLLKMQKQLVGKAQLIVPGRKYVGRGPVKFAPSGKIKPRILFLFTDILLVTSSTTNEKYKIRHEFYLKNLLIKVLEPSSSLKNVFCIADKGQDNPWRFSTKSQDERDLWIKKLSMGKAACSDYFAINRMSKYASVLYNPEAYKSIVEVLNDPSFEYSQPSWLRRRQHSTKWPETTQTAPSSAAGEVEEIDLPINDAKGVKAPLEEIKTEFTEDEEQREKVLLTMTLNPGIDNSLSSYMNQRSKTGEFWKERWFVLMITNRMLVCYENHLYDEAIGAIPLAGYKLSLPTEADNVKRLNVLKLTHPKNPTYFFELPSTYDYEKWSAILKELLTSAANSY